MWNLLGHLEKELHFQIGKPFLEEVCSRENPSPIIPLLYKPLRARLPAGHPSSGPNFYKGTKNVEQTIWGCDFVILVSDGNVQRMLAWKEGGETVRVTGYWFFCSNEAVGEREREIEYNRESERASGRWPVANTSYVVKEMAHTLFLVSGRIWLSTPAVCPSAEMKRTSYFCLNKVQRGKKCIIIATIYTSNTPGEKIQASRLKKDRTLCANRMTNTTQRFLQDEEKTRHKASKNERKNV